MPKESLEEMMRRVNDIEKKNEMLSRLMSRMSKEQEQDPSIEAAAKELNEKLEEIKKKYGVQLVVNPVIGFQRIANAPAQQISSEKK